MEYSSRRGWIAIGVFVGILLVMLLFWEAQAYRMRGEFVDALRNGTVGTLPLELRGKTWTDDEIATLRVIKVARSAGKEQALLRLAHGRGEEIVPNGAYGYQAMITDLSTGIRHVFGRSRSRPGVWNHYTVDPDSLPRIIEQRQEQMDEFMRQRKPN